MSFPIVSIDIETGGIEDNVDILEFAAVLDDLSNPRQIEDLPFFQTYFIKDNYIGEPTALAMHPKIFKRIATREKGYNYMSATKLGNVFKQFLIKNGYNSERDTVTINAAGKNFAAFDLRFLKSKTDLLKHVNIRSRILDPGILFLNKDDNSIPGMAECKKRCGLNEFISHEAKDDAIDVIMLLREKLSFMRGE